MPDPWVAVEATVRRSEKLAALPSDTARWGWVVMLGEAKLLRRQGSFTPGQWAEVMGRYAKYLYDYLAWGLIHRAPDYCAEDRREVCLRGRGPFPDGTLVVHDWPRHQREHAVRQADYVGRQSDTSSDGESDAVSDAKSDSHNDIPSRALSSSSVRVFSSPGEGYGEGVGSDDPEWPAMVWLAEHHASVSEGSKLHLRLIRLTEKHTSQSVIRAMAALGDNLEANQYILGADNALNPIPSARPMTAKDERKAVLEAMRNAG